MSFFSLSHNMLVTVFVQQKFELCDMDSLNHRALENALALPDACPYFQGPSFSSKTESRLGLKETATVLSEELDYITRDQNLKANSNLLSDGT